MKADKSLYLKWVDGCLSDDRESQRQLYKTFHGKMLSICMRYAKDRDEAKDILQDGFIKVFQSLGKFNREGSLEGWIRRIVVNTAIDRIRKDKRSAVMSNSEDLLDEGIQDEVIVEDERMNLDMKDVITAMQDLSPGYKAVFNLYVMEDMTHKEIAEQLGISEGTSKSNLAKAKLNLRKTLLENINK
ncbi:MAG: sigma-70 family RNA polymerase sigma factor [Bacteroidetes bacterium]|nr:sigma-70 family RNA polymerase sigma factor [Bacteroidota bacterium]